MERGKHNVTDRQIVDAYINFQKENQDKNSLRTLYELFCADQRFNEACQIISKFDEVSQMNLEESLKFHASLPKRFLNIGGGPTFLYPYWANLESAPGPLNPKPFQLNENCRFPFASGSFDFVYSSHAFEHLDEPTVDTVLQETKRIIKPGHPLLIRFPDYDKLFDAYRRREEDYFSDRFWGLSIVTATLHNRGLSDSIHTRAAYIVCGFWNQAFGHLYTAPKPGAPGAYNGPAALPDAELSRILSQESPLSAAREFRSWVVSNEPSYTFNHQTAWSRQEFVTLLERHGFEVVSTDGDKSAQRFSFVPGIRNMHDISAYFFALPR
jgi:hypothetical protein